MESIWRLLISHHKDFIQMAIAYFTSYSLSRNMIHPPVTTSNGKPRHEPYRLAPYNYRLNCVDFLFDPIIIAADASWRGHFARVNDSSQEWLEPYRPEPYRRAVPLQMVSDMRRTRWQVLYVRKARDARYPNSTTFEWPLASDWSPVVNEECSKYVTLDKKLIQSSPFYFSDDDHSVDKVTIPSKVHNMEEAGPSVTEKPTNGSLYNMEEAGPSLTENPINGSLRLELALENDDHDTMIAAPSVRDLDHLAEVSRMRQV
ncbi:hypothetical protein Tco_0948626 [Tanacetum coccineum]